MKCQSDGHAGCAGHLDIPCILRHRGCFTAPKPPALICHKEPCLANVSSLDYVELRTEIYKDPNAKIMLEDFHPDHPEKRLCHDCLSKCRREGTCISTCNNAVRPPSGTPPDPLRNPS
eukprot:1176212-Prorocentrum_minimum.AAC.2